MKRAVILLAALLLGGCFDFSFDPPYLVKSARFLAIAAEPPEVTFGEDVLFEALVVDADGSDLSADPGVELRFTVCLSVAEIVAAAGLGVAAGGNLDDNCAEGGDDLVRLEQGGDLPPGTARLPGEAFFALLEELMRMVPAPGDGLPPGSGNIDPEVIEALTRVIAEVGVPLRVRVEVWRDGELAFAGFKRFAIAQRPELTTNPPPPRFAVGDVWLSARGGGHPRTCVPEEGAAPTVEAGSEVVLSPDENEDEWRETYPVVGLDGAIQTGREGAYYSWFSTGGEFSAAITQAPDRDVIWTAPEAPGTYPLWVVVRDGHLGISWCRTEVTVE